MSKHDEPKRMAECAIGFSDVSLAPDVLLELIKDAERYRWLRNAKGLSLRSDGSKWTRSNGEQFICSHHLCAFDTSYAPFESLDEVIDTAMAQGEQS